MRIAIVDDEQFFRLELKKLVHNILDDHCIIETFENGIDFINANKYYDLVLLDVEMPHLDGITLSKQIIKQVAFIIFITSHEERVYDAFGINVYAYVLKKHLNTELKKHLVYIRDYMMDEKKYTFIIKEGDLKLSINDIYFISRIDRKVWVHTVNKKYHLPSMTLQQVYGYLDEKLLYIDKSCLVNAKHIYTINKEQVTLDNGANLQISRSKLKSVKLAVLETGDTSCC